MPKFVHANKMIFNAGMESDCDLWVNVSQVLNIHKADGEVRCAVVGEDEFVLAIDTWYTESADDILSRLIERPEPPKVNW